MSIDVSKVVPPDDSGTDTFRRFCYQAHVAFPFCLECALGGEVISVVAEHVEDIAVERPSTWQFIQIKTRNAERGPWRLSDITGSGGAFRTALRSHRALGNAPVTIEIFLEGALKPGDDIVQLKAKNGASVPQLREKLQEVLCIDSVECNDLLGRLRLFAELPSRDGIVDRNIRLLGDQAPHLPIGVIKEIYSRVSGRIFEAMALDLLDPEWFAAVFNPAAAPEEAERTYVAKRLTRGDLEALVAPLTAPVRALLRRIVEPNTDPPTILEEKLLAGGAPELLVSDAKSLRANAAIAELEYAAASLWESTSQLEDVREWLRIRVNSLLLYHAADPQPAVKVWHSLLSNLPTWADTVDGFGIFHRDPDLLLGEVCEMADLCQVNWGGADAP
jgi:hypothetical protein